jgi:molybdopterin molybdotransferase
MVKVETLPDGGNGDRSNERAKNLPLNFSLRTPKLLAMIPVSEAIRIVLQHTPNLESEAAALGDATGRILAEDIVADSDLPPFDRAQMDGYAVRAADVANTPARLRIVGESAAGAGWHHEMKAGEAVRIMTGAPVPAGADAVQQVELTREVDGGSQVEILEPVEAGRSIVKASRRDQSRRNRLACGRRYQRRDESVVPDCFPNH